jgi:hypothetical protein
VPGEVEGLGKNLAITGSNIPYAKAPAIPPSKVSWADLIPCPNCTRTVPGPNLMC